MAAVSELKSVEVFIHSSNIHTVRTKNLPWFVFSISWFSECAMRFWCTRGWQGQILWTVSSVHLDLFGRKNWKRQKKEYKWGMSAEPVGSSRIMVGTSAHSHPSGKAGFRLRNDGEQHKAVSKNIQPGPGKHRGLRVTLWALLPLLRVTWGWLDSQPLLLIEWKWNGKSQGLSCRNTHGFHSLLPPSHVGSGRCNHWAGPGRCRRDGRGYCHIHWCRCHTLPLRR